MKATDRTKNCIVCGKTFNCPYGTGIGVWNKRKFCSLNCLSKLNDKKVVVLCLNCSKEISISPSRLGRTKFCSKKCTSEYKKTHSSQICKQCGNEFWSSYKTDFCSKGCRKISKMVETHCVVCNNAFLTIPSKKRKTCSKECNKLYLREIRPRGENHPMWRGGFYPESKAARNIAIYKDWRKAVFERDNYTCVMCGKRGVYIQAHHIKPFKYFENMRYQIDNGQTLCIDCHKKTDTFAGKALNFISNRKEF